MAQLIRMGWFRPVHVKTVPAQEIRALLTGRKLLQIKLRDIELGIRGLLRGFGLKVGKVSEGKYDARIRELATGHPMLEPVAAAMLQARASLRAEYAKLHRMLLRIVRADAVCRRFMTAPGIGAVVAVSYRTAVDDPTRFHKSRDLGPYFGLTPSKYQSGEVDRTGRITKVGDVMVRTALFEAAHVILTRVTRFSTLKAWALRIAKQRGFKRAKVALARKLAVGWCCIACGSTAPTSAGARQRRKRTAGSGKEDNGEQSSSITRSRRRDARSSEAAQVVSWADESSDHVHLRSALTVSSVPLYVDHVQKPEPCDVIR